MRHQESSIRDYLKQREATGRVIIHNLIEPSYNMLALSRELKGVERESDDDKTSVNLMIALAERILSQVINLHDISFNNDRLVFLSIFDIQEIIRHLMSTRQNKGVPGSKIILVHEEDGPVQVLGDRELTRFWIDSVLNLVFEIYGKGCECAIQIESDDETMVVVRLRIMNGASSDFSANYEFMDKAQHVDYITRLLHANVTMEEQGDMLEVSLAIPKDPKLMEQWLE